MRYVAEHPAKPLIAGALLVALVVVATVLARPDYQAFEDEAVVLAAISEMESAEDHCDVSYGNFDDEPEWHRWSWGDDEAARKGRLDLLYPDETLTSVMVECIVADTPRNAWFEINLRYHLKVGRQAEAINQQVRQDVAAAVTWYFADTLETYGDSLLSEPSDSIHSEGFFDLLGVVAYSSDSLYSVELSSKQMKPATMGTDTFLRTRNYDLSTGQQLRLDDLFIADSGWEEVLIEAMAQQAPKTEDMTTEMRAGWVMSIGTPSAEQIRAQEFTLGASGLRLSCRIYCYLDESSGIAPILFWMTASHEIPYGDLTEYLDPEGPYRYIVGDTAG